MCRSDSQLCGPKKRKRLGASARIMIPGCFSRTDGSMPREMTRTNLLGYTVFNLQALTHLADLASRTGVDLWDYQTTDGRGIRQAIVHVLPYITGEKRWNGQQILQFRDRGMFIPLRRVGSALHERRYQRAADALKHADKAGIDSIRFPAARDIGD